MIEDKLGWKTKWTIEKFKDPNGEVERLLHEGKTIEEIERTLPDAHFGHEEIDGNVALNEGLQEVLLLITGAGGTAYNQTNTYIGVGESSTNPTDPTLTGLQGSTKTFKQCDASYPTRASQTVTWRGVFGSSDANNAWEEFTVVNASTDTGKNLNRKCSSKGTKSSGETWTLDIAITLS